MNRFQTFVQTAEQIKQYLPQRPPLLLVDKVTGLGTGPQPALRAGYLINANEAVLAGHFPGRPLWPGVYTIEGLAQTCALLGGLLTAFVVDPSALAPLVSSWKIPSMPTGKVGLLVRADVKLTKPITPPSELSYEVVLMHVVGAICRFDVEAIVTKESVAKGTITVAIEE